MLLCSKNSFTPPRVNYLVFSQNSISCKCFIIRSLQLFQKIGLTGFIFFYFFFFIIIYLLNLHSQTIKGFYLLPVPCKLIKISWAKTLYFDFTKPLGCFAKIPPICSAVSKDLQLMVPLKLRSGIFPVPSCVNRRSLSLEFQCERSVELWQPGVHNSVWLLPYKHRAEAVTLFIMHFV